MNMFSGRTGNNYEPECPCNDYIDEEILEGPDSVGTWRRCTVCGKGYEVDYNCDDWDYS